MKVSIIVPCYNELNTIEEIVLRILKYVKYDKEIIIVDDGSSDGTEDIIRNKLSSQVSKLIQNDKNYGKGYSVRKGIQAATGDIIVIQDADLEYHPSDLNKLIDPIKNGFADVVYGSRFISTEERRVLNYWHSIGNYFLTFLSNIFTNINLTDMEVGYKVFKSEILKNIDLKENRFGFEPEVTAKISNKNIRIFEVGIKYFGRNYSEGKKINWKDGISAIRFIFQYNLFTK